MRQRSLADDTFKLCISRELENHSIAEKEERSKLYCQGWSSIIFCRNFFSLSPEQERRDAALRGRFTVKRRPQAVEGVHPLVEAGRKSHGIFDIKPKSKVVVDPLAVRPLLNVASLPSRKPIGVYAKERR